MESFRKIDEERGTSDILERSVVHSIALCAVDLDIVEDVHLWVDVERSLPDEM